MHSFRTLSFALAFPLALGSAGCFGLVNDSESTETSDSALSFNFGKIEYKVGFVPGPGELIVDGTSNTIALVTNAGPGRQSLGLKQPGKPWAGYEVTFDGVLNPAGLDFSLSGTDVTLHGVKAGGVFSAGYALGGTAGKKGPISAFQAPTLEVEEIEQQIAAGEVVLPSTGEALTLGIALTSSGDVVGYAHSMGGFVDLLVSSYTPPIGSNKGSFTIGSDGHGWATFPSSDSLYLYSLGHLDSHDPLDPELVATLSVGADYRPGSARLGIIAILIGLVVTEVPTVSYQVGNELVQVAWDGTKFKNLSRQAIPSGSSGLTMEEGIYWYANTTGVYRGQLGSPATLVQ